MIARASVVSRLLASRGVKRSNSHTTRVRGWHNVTEGFEAMQYPDSVRVDWRLGDWFRGENQFEVIVTNLAKVKEVLEAAGYTVVDSTVGAINRPILRVTKA